LRDSRHGVPELGIILFRDIRPWGDFSLKFLRSARGNGYCSECNIMVPDWLGHLGRGRFEHQPRECDRDLLACLRIIARDTCIIRLAALGVERKLLRRV